MIDRKICPVMTAGAMVCGRCALWVGKPNDDQWVNYGTRVCVWPSAMCRASNPCTRKDKFKPRGGSHE